MKQLVTALCIGAILLAVSGCAQPRIMIDRVLVQNGTNSQITDVEVRHEPTMKYGGVSAILPQEALDVGISKRPMLAKRAVISWVDGSGRKWQEAVQLPYHREVAQTEQAMNLVYVLQSSGRVTTYLQTSAK